MRGVSLAAALIGALMGSGASLGPMERGVQDYHRRMRADKPPRQTGPVFDSTPESKRAKRRRLAKEGK